ncbi:MAG: class I SAM-dependent methyltransferase [Acidobacteria bacterium]|nr:class I SAM-dependent methyltransferase [Acidobacteriota bacterium]
MNPAEYENLLRAEERMWWFDGMRDILFRLLHPHAAALSGARMLEVGCGTGYNARLLEDRYRCAVTALDLSAPALRHCRRRGLNSVVRGNLASLPFRSHSFDAAMALDVLVYFPPGSEHTAMRELARVVRPGGLVVVRVAALNWLRSRHSSFVGEVQRFTRSSLLASARAAALSPLRCTYANSLLLPLAAFKFRIWEPLTRAQPESGVTMPPAWLNHSFRAALRAEAAWIASGRHLPCGQSLVMIARTPAGDGLPL